MLHLKAATRFLPRSYYHDVVDMLKHCIKLIELKSVHAYLIKSSGDRDCFYVNQFIIACSQSDNMHYAQTVYSEMENPNVFVFNAMIRGLSRWNLPSSAMQIFRAMLSEKVSPSSYTFSSLISVCCRFPDSRMGSTIHTHLWKFGFQSDMYVQTSLLLFYSLLGEKSDFLKVFDEMQTKDTYAMTTTISGLARIGDLTRAKTLFDSMPEKTISSCNALLDGYSRAEDVSSAENLFDEMPKRDIVSWTIMINLYCATKNFQHALRVFQQMNKEGISPDEVTLSTLISACADFGALQTGQEFHCISMAHHFHFDVYIGSALVDMYAKCGAIERSLVTFFKLKEKNLYCWNAVIEALSSHGYSEQALAMFKKMEKGKVKPNGVTFVSVLGACAHAGLVEEGQKRFLSMKREYSIEPEVVHYGCMVDLLSKSGLLEEALEMVRKMKCEPNGVIWGALLSGCKVHKNLGIGAVAVRELMALEPDNSGYFNLLVSMYAGDGQWDCVRIVRKCMRECGIEKASPGMSWIEVNRRVHQFASCDKSSFHWEDIWLILSGINDHMKCSNGILHLSW